MPFRAPSGTAQFPGSQGFDLAARFNPLKPKNLLYANTALIGGRAGVFLLEHPIVMAKAINWSMGAAALNAAIAPLWPAAVTSIRGSYQGKVYEPHIGFGFEGSTVKAKRHSFVGPLLRMYLGASPAGRWVGKLDVPTFGFGIESREIASTRYQISTERISSPRSSDRPMSSQQVRSRGAGAPSTFTSGYRKPANKSARRGQASSRGVNPFCWVHKRRHWCKYTRQ